MHHYVGTLQTLLIANIQIFKYKINETIIQGLSLNQNPTYPKANLIAKKISERTKKVIKLLERHPCIYSIGFDLWIDSKQLYVLGMIWYVNRTEQRKTNPPKRSQTAQQDKIRIYQSSKQSTILGFFRVKQNVTIEQPIFLIHHHPLADQFYTSPNFHN